MIYEPKWKSLLANTVGPLFTPQQCQDIINMGHKQKAEKALVGHEKGITGGKYDTKKRVTTISWIPFKALPEMYKIIETTMLRVNGNHFGYEGMQLTEVAQFTEYPKGGFYDWHMDADVNCQYEPPVRKISMTILLSPQMKIGDFYVFPYDVRHCVYPMTNKKAKRRTLVCNVDVEYNPVSSRTAQ